MAGGLFNIVSVGNANVILTGNPTKTFFRCVYSKYTNFGLQKFRIDYDGLRELRLTDSSTFTFKIPRYAELLMDTYLVLSLPDIWSPIYPPVSVDDDSTSNTNSEWAPYDFKWIKNIGTTMIQEITITCGNLTLQKYSGEYLSAIVERDFNTEKKNLYNTMTGNVAELYDPANSLGRQNTYPNAFYTNKPAGAEPSIRGRTLYVPINTWFTLDSRCAFPLVALQYNELIITVTIRPIQELFCVRDVFNPTNDFPYIQPNFTKQEFQMYRFLQTPPNVNISQADYDNKNSTWKSDVHLMSTYCFLSKEERELFASQEQVYLVKDVYEYNFDNITGSKKVKLSNSNGMISNWMWFFRRNDAYLRNEWNNYTNWPYETLPKIVEKAPNDSAYVASFDNKTYGPGINPPREGFFTGDFTGHYITGDYSSDNHKDILETMAVVLNGEYRENMLTRGVYDYIEKYTRTQGFAKEGLYCYNFCLNTSPFEYQPSGAINMSKFKSIELEITTYTPSIAALDSNMQYGFICDNNGNIIGIRKQNWKLFDYTYNMVLFEERYNVLSFINGNCGMLYAR